MPTAGTGDIEIWYETAGERGERVLLVQGVGAVGEGWRWQTDALQAEFRLAWFDNRGIGRSAPLTGRQAPKLSIEQMATDALGLLDHLGWKRAHVVGHSMGGLIAQQMALNAPTRVASLALLSTFASGKGVGAAFWSTLWMGLRTRIGTRRMRRRAMVDMVFPRAWQETAGVDALIRDLEVVFGGDIASQPPIAMKQLMAARRHDVSRRLGELEMPVLVATGERDRIAVLAQSQALAAAIPGARLVTYPAAGHAVTIQCADEINALLAQHLRDAAAANG